MDELSIGIIFTVVLLGFILLLKMPIGLAMAMAGAMGMMPVSVMPMNSMASATTTYFVDCPIDENKNIDGGGYLKLTFPRGFDVSAAVPDHYNPEY